MKYKIIGIVLSIVLGVPAVVLASLQVQTFLNDRQVNSVVATIEKTASVEPQEIVTEGSDAKSETMPTLKVESSLCLQARSDLKILQNKELKLKQELVGVKNGTSTPGDPNDLEAIQKMIAEARLKQGTLEKELDNIELQEKDLASQIKSCNP